MEEKNRNHGPTEEELSESVKEAYTSVYELDPMAEDFDEEDDFQVEIVGAPSAAEAGGENANVSAPSAEKAEAAAVNGADALFTEEKDGTEEETMPLIFGQANSPEKTGPGSGEETEAEPVPETSETAGSAEQTGTEPAPETSETAASAEQTGTEPVPETSEAAGSAEQTGTEPVPETSETAGSAEQTEEEPADEPDSGEEPPKKKKGKAGIIIGLVLFLAVVSLGAVSYIHFRGHFTDHFYPGTVINGIDISEMTIEEAKNAMQEMVDTYALTISEKENKEETIDAKSIELRYVDDGKIDDILGKQDAKKWFLFPFKKHIYSLKTSTRYSEEKLTKEIDGLTCLDESAVTMPEDATLVVEGSTCTIKPEVEGTQVDRDKLVKAITSALSINETGIDIVQDDCYVHPDIYRDDENLKSRMDQWNVYLSCNINYWFGENVEVINADSLRDNIVDDGTSVTVPYEYIRKLVYGWGQKYDTFGLDRQFTTHSGETITVVNEGEGDYGWCSDKDKTIADVTEAIESGYQGDRNVVWLYEAMGWDNGDLTGTYVEVSLSEQKLWCYQDYNLVMETDVVTGTNTPERETKRGIYAIDAKKEHATLGTLDVQGYASPVDYWAPFNGGQGLHDAPWRSSFGGSIYQYNGSHGCVNIPPANMKTIFDAVSIGTAVIVY